ncbi:MAG: LTA synthase family protein [Eubacterium sp.]|nr:LTA synthase family protein [Eubacterium sp.]
MFLLGATAAALIMAVLEIIFVADKKKVLPCIGIVLKNIVVIDVASIAVQKYLMKYQHFLDTSKYNTGHFVKFFFVSLVVGIGVQAVFAVLSGKLMFQRPAPYKKKWVKVVDIVIKVLAILLFAIGAIAKYGSIWAREAFGSVTADQLIINMTSGTEGTELSVYIEGFEGPFFQILAVTVLFGVVLFSRFDILFKWGKRKPIKTFCDLPKRILCLVFAAVFFYSGMSIADQKLDLYMVINSYFINSSFIEDNYADPETTPIEFPAQKRNLIHIYLESWENSYLKPELGGFEGLGTDDLMPNLTELSYEGIIFSDTDNYFGGPHYGTGTQWSIASMVNQTTGLPMKAPGYKNTYGSDGNFLPGAFTLGQILEREGYEQTMMIGASAGFGALDQYYLTHGNWNIFDYNYAKENGYIPSDYKVFWGYEDDKLYEYAKEEITRLYETGKPFNFTMETADTHRPNGYVTPGKETPFESPYANAIWNSDQDVVAFVNWIKQQPFYENTTIVLIGDHCSMETKFFEDYGFTDDYLRTQYNCILNADPTMLATFDAANTKNRKWANWDYFPTIIASIGGKIEGERLGIGTNLFSGEPTIFEEYGEDKANTELEKKSTLYNEKILETDDLSSVVGDGPY